MQINILKIRQYQRVTTLWRGMQTIKSATARTRNRLSKTLTGSPKRWWQGGLLTALMVMAFLAIPQPAAACSSYNPLCWVEKEWNDIWDTAKDALELAWNVITLKPEDAWNNVQDISGDIVCNGLSVGSILAGLGGSGAQHYLDDCESPSHPIEPDVLAQFSLYFKPSLNSVRIHEGCKIDKLGGERAAITFGEHIYFKKDKYQPYGDDGFAMLAHELIHVLQYRQKGFRDFICEYGVRSATSLLFDKGPKSTPIEQEAYRYQALVLEDRKRDRDGKFTCRLEEKLWYADNVGDHDCNKNEKFLACNSNTGGAKPDFCKAMDNCPNRFNPGQEDSDGNAIGNACDVGWTSDPDKPTKFQNYGDFNGDYKKDILIKNGIGLGILTYDGSSLTTLMFAPNGTWFGGWQYDTLQDHIVAIADFNGDHKADILITGPQGIGILTFDGSSLTSLMVAPNGTRFGGWRFSAVANRIIGTGDFNHDRRPDIVITSAWGIGILTFDGSSLTSLMVAPNGTWFGGWRFDSLRNSIEGFGDFDHDDKDDILIRSDWGIGILTLRDTTLTSLMGAPYGTRIGNWTLSKDDRIAAIGHFSNYDAAAQILIISKEGLAILGRHVFDASDLTTYVNVANGVRLGDWRLDTKVDSIAGIIRGVLEDDIIIRSPWGIGILHQDDSSLKTLMLAPSGTHFDLSGCAGCPPPRPGSWNYNSATDQILGVAAFAGGLVDSDILISNITMRGGGVGILSPRSSEPQSLTLKSLMVIDDAGLIFNPTPYRVIGIDMDIGAQSVPTWVSGHAQ